MTRRLRLRLIAMAAFLLPVVAQSQLRQRPRYVLRPGDTLQTQYRFTPELNQTVSIQPDGFIALNLVGELKVSGLTVEQAHDLILSKETQLKNPDLNLLLEEFTRPYVIVAGEVVKPGQIEVRERMSALSAILLAGGFTQSAKSGQVIIFRRVGDDLAEVRQLSLTVVRKNADLEKDLEIEPGDMILVSHDKVSRLSHYISLTSVGFYLDPTQFF